MITRILKELSDNYKELSGNYISMKKDIKTMNENKEEMKNIVQAIKSRLDEPEDWKSKMEDKVQQNTQSD